MSARMPAVGRSPVADLVAGCSTQIDHSGQADYSGDLDYRPGTGRAGGQLGPAGGSGSEMAAGAVAEGHHPVSIYVFERGWWSIAEVKVELLTPSAAQGLSWSDEVAHRSGDLVAAVMGRG